ncbi:MAG: bifunctional demethylmenaquinone methyltransferase/2-methoxy-6-polyprenyl-1,4-benzoquinol methylase UbiE, partial [Pseudomonadota bacterium]
APQYDIMNDLMSLGMHRFWKKFAIMQTQLKPGNHVLDLAGGTGDLTKLLLQKVGEKGKVTLSDINSSMLKAGRARLTDCNYLTNVDYVQADAERLPFPDNTFDGITISFGLRNITNKENALAEMYRVLKPGKKLIVLEFSKPKSSFLNKIYNEYSFRVIPKLGEWIAKDKASYQYLVESIRMHPDQETLLKLIEKVRFEKCGYHNLSGGIVALHYGYKI